MRFQLHILAVDLYSCANEHKDLEKNYQEKQFQSASDNLRYNHSKLNNSNFNRSSYKDFMALFTCKDLGVAKKSSVMYFMAILKKCKGERKLLSFLRI